MEVSVSLYNTPTERDKNTKNYISFGRLTQRKIQGSINTFPRGKGVLKEPV